MAPLITSYEYSYYRTLAYNSFQLDQLFMTLEQYIGYYVYTYAQPAFQATIYYLRKTLHELKPFLIVAYPIVGQIIIMALGFALIPVLGPFGPLITQLVGQLIMYVLKMFIDNISSELLLYYYSQVNASNLYHCLLYSE